MLFVLDRDRRSDSHEYTAVLRSEDKARKLNARIKKIDNTDNKQTNKTR